MSLSVQSRSYLNQIEVVRNIAQSLPVGWQVLIKEHPASMGRRPVSYYQKLLAGQGRATALREAMLELRTAQPHPHDWAPFIALGSDAPLRAIVPAAPRP